MYPFSLSVGEPLLVLKNSTIYRAQSNPASEHDETRLKLPNLIRSMNLSFEFSRWISLDIRQWTLAGTPGSSSIESDRSPDEFLDTSLNGPSYEQNYSK